MENVSHTLINHFMFARYIRFFKIILYFTLLSRVVVVVAAGNSYLFSLNEKTKRTDPRRAWASSGIKKAYFRSCTKAHAPLCRTVAACVLSLQLFRPSRVGRFRQFPELYPLTFAGSAPLPVRSGVLTRCV